MGWRSQNLRLSCKLEISLPVPHYFTLITSLPEEFGKGRGKWCRGAHEVSYTQNYRRQFGNLLLNNLGMMSSATSETDFPKLLIIAQVQY